MIRTEQRKAKTNIQKQCLFRLYQALMRQQAEGMKTKLVPFNLNNMRLQIFDEMLAAIVFI